MEGSWEWRGVELVGLGLPLGRRQTGLNREARPKSELMVGFKPVTSHNFRYVNLTRHVVCFLVKIGESIRVNLDQMF